jgi:hypothetical protein
MRVPRMAQVARKRLAEKRARRVRGAIGLGNLTGQIDAQKERSDTHPNID